MPSCYTFIRIFAGRVRLVKVRNTVTHLWRALSRLYGLVSSETDKWNSSAKMSVFSKYDRLNPLSRQLVLSILIHLIFHRVELKAY